MRHQLLELELANDRDMIAARQRARQVSALLDFDAQDQVRIATAVSEVARNAVRHGGGGRIEFALEEEGGRNPALSISIADQGPGIADFETAIGGTTATGEPKLGLVTARRLMDAFEIQSAPRRGTSITLRKHVPRRAEPFTRARIEALGRAVAAHRTSDASVEMQQQNRDLLRSLEELRLRQEELTRLNAELEDTNRGVMALYSELDERAAHLRAADETKTRFLSSVSHEFRTPVNSILALSKILLHRLDGELTAEQEKQVKYICQAADQLSTLIDDLLDLRKVEAGKIQLRAETFTATDLFAALRGMFKPLAVNENVALVIDEPADLPELYTDQGKVSQILRNLVSNALKFTVRGSVRVSCRLSQDEQLILFEVADTGIGIAPENHRRIFDEFSQVENPLQTSVKGTGLGLPLSQRLAGLLGGGIEIRSALGQGSTFTLAIPVRIDGERGADAAGFVGAGDADGAGSRADHRRQRDRALRAAPVPVDQPLRSDRGDRRLRRPAAGSPGAPGRDLPRPDDAGRPRLRSAQDAQGDRRHAAHPGRVVHFAAPGKRKRPGAGGGGRCAADEKSAIP